MSILIVGASGFMGGELYRRLHGRHVITGTYHSYPVEGMVRLDLTDQQCMSDLVDRLRPEIIIQPAMNANVEYCEEHPMETRNVNVEGSKNLIRAAARAGARYVYFSSDYIFDGADGPYAEEDTPNPLNEYGRQKLEIERVVREQIPDHLIIRTTVVYGWEARGKNFVMGLLRTLGQGRPMRVPVDQIGSPTYVDNLADIITELVVSGKTGTYNVAGSDVVGRYDFALTAASIFGLDPRLVIPVRTGELGQKASRPLKAGMKLDKLRKNVSTPIMGIVEGLRDMRDKRTVV